jgi:hypothetical protein
MRELIVDPAAKLDASDIADYYDTANLGLGTDFLMELARLISLIHENPLLYPQYVRHTRKASLSRFPYWVLYWFNDQLIHVVAIVDARRSPKWIETRLP